MSSPRGHLLPTLALACAAASAWLPVPLAPLLVASAGLRGAGPRVALAASAAALALAAAPFGAPADVAPETLAGLRRLLDAYGPPGAAAALVTHPVRAVAAVAESTEWAGVAAGAVATSAGWIAIGAALARVPRPAWRALGWAAAGALAATVASWGFA